RQGMHTAVEVAASTFREWRRCAPHGSLPPCGGGTGRGVAAKHQAEARSMRRPERHFVDFGCGRDAVRVLYPSPCPSPARGEGTLWHRSAHLRPFIRIAYAVG